MAFALYFEDNVPFSQKYYFTKVKVILVLTSTFIKVTSVKNRRFEVAKGALAHFLNFKFLVKTSTGRVYFFQRAL